jgi:hypothetical protein
VRCAIFCLARVFSVDIKRLQTANRESVTRTSRCHRRRPELLFQLANDLLESHAAPSGV